MARKGVKNIDECERDFELCFVLTWMKARHGM